MQITIFAHPNSRKPRIEHDLHGSLHVYVSDPPQDEKANAAIVLALARHFKVSRTSIRLIRGKKSKLKIFEIFKFGTLKDY